MNSVEHNTTPSTSPGSAPDIPSKANLVIWTFFLAFGLGLYLMISAVNLYFRMETEKEEFAKVGSLESKTLIDLRAEEADILSGKVGMLEGKKHISIADAMNKVLQVTQ